MTKTTLRLPEILLERLRERSREEGLSLNTVAVETLWRGLGLEPALDDVAAILRDMVVHPATRDFDPEVLEQRLSHIGREARDLTKGLEWTREDRD